MLHKEEASILSECVEEMADRIIAYVHTADFEALEAFYQLCFGKDDLFKKYEIAAEDLPPES